jgi:DNA-binding GntR family transcriptional regulator
VSPTVAGILATAAVLVAAAAFRIGAQVAGGTHQGDLRLRGWKRLRFVEMWRPGERPPRRQCLSYNACGEHGDLVEAIVGANNSKAAEIMREQITMSRKRDIEAIPSEEGGDHALLHVT